MAYDLQPSYYTSRWTGEEIDRLLEGGNMVITERVASLSALRSKYPSGADGFYLTSDNNHVYWWDKTAKTWVDLGAIEGPQGPTGAGIDNIQRTSGTGLSGSLDVYTVTLSDGKEFTFTVQNGRDGNIADAEAANELAKRLLSETRASATEAKDAASEASASASSARSAASSASGSAASAAASEKNAASSAATAKEKADSATASATAADKSATAAKEAKTEAAKSQSAAKASETNAKGSETAANKSASAASDSAAAALASQQAAAKSQTAAKASADLADANANRAESARTGAEAAQRAVENLGVSAHSIAAGSEATVTKSVADSGVTLYFGIPLGEQGAVGPAGPQGAIGPVGPAGPAGTVVPADGLYGFSVNGDGHLILSYSGGEAPQFELKTDGHLYYTL